MSKPYIIGVDPGAPLWLALLDPDGNVIKATDPEHVALIGARGAGMKNQAVMVASTVKVWRHFAVKRSKNIAMVAETVGARPEQGVVSTSKYIASFSLVQGIAAALEIPFYEVTPSKWKRDLCIQKSTKMDEKETARQFAMNVWPSAAHFWARKKDHNKAEAALIALWCCRKVFGP